ncbi:Efflux pump membrane transporter BepE [compost metagenome]
MEHSRFNLSRWALEHQPLTRYLLVVLLIGGLLAFFQLGQDEDPPFTFRVMVVQAYWPGATAEQIAVQVTDKIERQLQEVPYADKIRSFSKPGETTVIFQLADNSPAKDTAQIWYTVRKKIGDIAQTLPQGVRGPYFNDEFGDVYGSIYALSADGFNYKELREYADLVRQALLRVPAVAKVTLLGLQDEKLYIEFNQTRFAQLGLDINAIANQISEQNNPTGSGVLVTPTDNLQVRVTGQLGDVQDLENLVLRGPNGIANIRLGDIAHVYRGYIDPPASRMRFNGKDVIGLGISMEKGGDIIALGQELRRVTDGLRGQLPMGIEMDQVQDQPQAVKRSVGEFVHVLIEAVVIVLAVSFIALGLHTRPLRIDVRPGLVVALTIPLVLAVTFLFMNIFGIGLHTACIYPQRLREVLPLVDWVGFDIKAPFADYRQVTRVAGSGDPARACLDAILASGVAYECRTTTHPDLLPDEQLLALASTLAAKGVDNYVLQQFRAEGCADAALSGRPLHGYPAATTLAQIGAMFPRFTFRNHGS